ncbi:hypothetical protein PJM29_29480, partial [Mycobacterium kansasii]
AGADDSDEAGDVGIPDPKPDPSPEPGLNADPRPDIAELPPPAPPPLPPAADATRPIELLNGDKTGNWPG